jgi:hypothetical protein
VITSWRCEGPDPGEGARHACMLLIGCCELQSLSITKRSTVIIHRGPGAVNASSSRGPVLRCPAAGGAVVSSSPSNTAHANQIGPRGIDQMAFRYRPVIETSSEDRDTIRHSGTFFLRGRGRIPGHDEPTGPAEADSPLPAPRRPDGIWSPRDQRLTGGADGVAGSCSPGGRPLTTPGPRPRRRTGGQGPGFLQEAVVGSAGPRRAVRGWAGRSGPLITTFGISGLGLESGCPADGRA